MDPTWTGNPELPSCKRFLFPIHSLARLVGFPRLERQLTLWTPKQPIGHKLRHIPLKSEVKVAEDEQRPCTLPGPT